MYASASMVTQAALDYVLNITVLLFAFSFITAAHAQSEDDIRLVNAHGGSLYAGRVEIYHNGIWGTICDDGFGVKEGNVICRELNFGKVEKIFHKARLGKGKGPIWMDGLECSGEERMLADCKFDKGNNRYGVHNCEHQEDAGVRCKPREIPTKPFELPLRITCPPDPGEGSCNTCPDQITANSKCLPEVEVQGILEAEYDGTWYPISGSGWGAKEARTACGQLGYPVSWPAPSLDALWHNWDGLLGCAESGCSSAGLNEEYHDRLSTVVLDDTECSGSEQKLLECTLYEIEPHHSGRDAVATVACGYVPSHTEECYGSNSNFELYRLRGRAVPWSGRIEVKPAGGVWTTVCDVGWDVIDASIVCRHLGYGTAKDVFHRASFGRGYGSTNFTDLRCKGNELSLGQCTYMPTLLQDCFDHAGDAGVTCNHPEPSEMCAQKPTSRINTVSYVDLSNWVGNQPILEIEHDDFWGKVCTGTIDIHAATVACRENAENFAHAIGSFGSQSDFPGVSYSGSIKCSGMEMNFNECQMDLVVLNSCPQGYAVVHCTDGIADLVPSLLYFENSLRLYPYVDLIRMYYLSCAMDDACLSSSANTAGPNDLRELLRFDSLTMNLGINDFQPFTHPANWIWHNCHQHYHSFEAFNHYDVLDLNGKEVAEGHKASFCLEDSICIGVYPPRYRCSTGVQGISANCGDYYGRHLDCQWIDITGLTSGDYIVRQVVNPNRYVAESDYHNNVVQCFITYTKEPPYVYYIDVHSCSLSDH